MLVDTQELPDSKAESPATPSRHSPLRVRADLHEEYSPDEIAKMTELYEGDRKSTRLNSSHLVISYAVFCLQKNTRLNSSHLVISYAVFCFKKKKYTYR